MRGAQPTANDVARFHGRMIKSGGTINAQTCSSDTVSLGPNVDVSNDVMVASPGPTPGPTMDQRLLVSTSHFSTNAFWVTFCNMTTSSSLSLPNYVDYVVIDRP